MKGTVESSVAASCFSPTDCFARRMFPRRAAGVLGQRPRRMKAIDVSNLSDNFSGNNNAAAGSGGERLSVIFHERCKLFLNLLNLFPQIKQTTHGSLHPLFQYDLRFLRCASHPIMQGFLGKRVFELGSVAGVVYPMKQNMKLVLEPRSFLDQPLPLQR